MNHGPFIIGVAILTGAGFNWLWHYALPDAGAMDILALCAGLVLGLAAAVTRILAPKRPPYRSAPQGDAPTREPR